MKRIIILSLLATVFMLLSGCSAASGKDNSADANDASASTAPATEPSAEITEEEMETLAYKVLDDADIRNLKWGMSIEDVRVFEAEKITSEETVDNGIRLFYDNVDFEGSNSEMSLVVKNDIGLSSVTYRIKRNLYQHYYDELAAKYGEPNIPIDSSTAMWDIPNEEIGFFCLTMME